MEFIPFNNVARALSDTGVTNELSTENETELIHFWIDNSEQRKLLVHSGDAALADNRDANEKIAVEADQLATVCEEAISLLHLSEVFIMPASTWGKVLEVTAFDLTAHQAWLDVDAEASLHQNTRDALAVPPAERSFIAQLITSASANGDSRAHNLYVFSLSSKIVIEAHHDDYLIVRCTGDAALDALVRAFRH